MQDAQTAILVVEDEQPVRFLLIEILSSSFQCSGAGSASEALRLLETRTYGLALVDMRLPGLSGLSLCRLICNRHPKTTVIMISGDTDPQSAIEAMKAGAADFIVKPFNLSQITQTVQRTLDRRLPGAVA